MSRFGVMKYLRVREGAGLVTTHKVGRSKLHYLNAVPIREMHDRWIHKFAAGATAAPLGLKADVDKGAHMAATATASARDASRITWVLEEAGPGVSKLTVVHDGFESETATFMQIGGGMPFILSGLKTLLETASR